MIKYSQIVQFALFQFVCKFTQTLCAFMKKMSFTLEQNCFSVSNKCQLVKSYLQDLLNMNISYSLNLPSNRQQWPHLKNFGFQIPRSNCKNLKESNVDLSKTFLINLKIKTDRVGFECRIKSADWLKTRASNFFGTPKMTSSGRGPWNDQFGKGTPKLPVRLSKVK